jgi:hypothetical protein
MTHPTLDAGAKKFSRFPVAPILPKPLSERDLAHIPLVGNTATRCRENGPCPVLRPSREPHHAAHQFQVPCRECERPRQAHWICPPGRPLKKAVTKT